MLRFKSSPFEADVEKATHENNLTEDWSLIMHICDNATNFEDGAKYCLKAIIKRLYHNVPRVVLQALTLLDVCVKNCNRQFLLQIASSEFTNEVRKLLPKMHPSASTKLKELIQRWSLEEFKDDPELCIIPSLYYKLKSESVEFPPVEKEKKKTPVLCTNPDGVSSQEEENDIIKAIEISLKDTGRYEPPEECKNTASKSLPEPFKVRTIYDFDAAEDNELTIKVGEIVLVLDNSNSSWWKGSNHRGEGLFPANFVTEDLDFKPEEPKIIETVAKTVEAVSDSLEDVEVKLDEEKIEKLINWLNDIDPAEEVNDPEELLLLEKQCCNMTPIIEENLQAIDNRLAMLNLVNEKIMSAFELFHSLSDHFPVISQPLTYYATGSLSQHVVQFPHPQTTLPPGSMLQQVIQPPVPREMLHTPSVPQSINQVSLPVSQVQTVITQVPTMPSNANVNSTIPQAATTSQPNQTVSASSTSMPHSLPSNPTNPACNVGVIGGYCVPPQGIPYAMQYGPALHQPGYIQNPGGPLENIMTLPYAVPPVRPYYPFPYYFVNSNPLPPQTSTVTTTSVESSSEAASKSAVSTIVPQTNATVAVPSASSYSSDLHNLNLTASNVIANQIEKQENPSGVTNDTSDKKLESDNCETELMHKKNL